MGDGLYFGASFLSGLAVVRNHCEIEWDTDRDTHNTSSKMHLEGIAAVKEPPYPIM